MMDKQTIIDSHNLQTMEEYRKKQKERKFIDSNSPVRPETKPAPLRAKPSADFNIVPHLIRTQPLNFSPNTSPVLRGVPPQAQGSGKSSRALDSILNRCCVLSNPKAFDNQPLTAQRLRKGSSFGVLPDDAEEPVEEPRMTSTISTPTPGSTANTTPHRILSHNSQYKANRSSSVSKQASNAKGIDDKADQKAERASFKDMVGKNVKPTHVEKEKKSKLLNSFKDMITFKSFSKKKASDKAPDSVHHYCGCNQEKKFKNLKHEFDAGCIRSVVWLRNKFMSPSVHAELKNTFYDKFEGKSVSPTVKDHIQKDVVRTFSSNKDLSQDSVRARLERLLECVALVYPHIGYVQGMNFIAATLLYHCDEYCSLAIIRILFEQLELKDMFLPNLRGLDRHTEVIDTLIHLGLIDVWNILHEYKVTTQYFCTDWLMCLGFNMIPPEFSGQFLDLLLEYGWHYYYRVIIYYLKQLEPKIKNCKSQEDLFIILKMGKQTLKADGAKPSFNWPELIEEALYFSIDDSLIDKLNEKRQYKQNFKSCPKRSS